MELLVYLSGFIGRERELTILQYEWESNQSRMLILYGRRRVGKTTSITHRINNVGGGGLCIGWQNRHRREINYVLFRRHCLA